MLGSPLLGTAVGLVLLFATTALLCSGITEWLSNRLQMRAKYLLTGMRAMLDGPEQATDRGRKERGETVHEWVKDPVAIRYAVEQVRLLSPSSTPPEAPILTTALFDSPLLTSLQSRRVGVLRKGSLRNPQYVSGRTFARALVDLLVGTNGSAPPAVVTVGEIRLWVEELPADLPLRRQLLAFLARAGDDVDAFERAVEQWYDEQMAKIGGWYKRWARVILGVVGFLVAVAVNIDTLQVSHALYVDAPLQQAVVATANAGTLCQDVVDPGVRTTCVRRELEVLRVAGLPVGYSASCDWFAGEWRACWAWSDDAPPGGWDPLFKLVGWLATAFAVSFGAPFWFEALSKLGSLRNTGTRPPSGTASS